MSHNLITKHQSTDAEIFILVFDIFYLELFCRVVVLSMLFYRGTKYNKHIYF